MLNKVFFGGHFDRN